jgi:triacylglycerol esterase/lipase EstA (alpha/beta hydrolase family)
MRRSTSQEGASKSRAHGLSKLVFAVLGLVVLSACAAPIGVQKISSHRAQRDLTRSVLSSGELSEKARIFLRRTNQEQEWKSNPAGVLADLHEMMISEPTNVLSTERRIRALDSLAELAFAHADETRDRRYYLAAAMYAWFYMFPGDALATPNPWERGVRLSADLYNRGLTLAFTDPDSGEILLRDGEHELPFGTLRVDFDEEGLVWGDRVLTAFSSLADLRVKGLNNRYRMSGIGAPLGARASGPTARAEDADDDDEVEDGVLTGVRVAVTALLRFDFSQIEPGQRLYTADLSVLDYRAGSTVKIEEQTVPLEAEPTAALALTLTENPPWQRELKGFFQGDLALGQLGIVTLSPYVYGRIPVVLVHGTASSAGRWADLVNDLMSDPVLRRRYQVWLFSYNTGAPIAYSAWLLREAIANLVETVDPDGRDLALRNQVVIGHSQGGLLAKLLVVDGAQQFWDLVVDKSPEDVELEPQSRELLEGSLLVEPSPYVKEVVFLSTPHRGSRLADFGLSRLFTRFMRSPANLVAAVGDLFADDPKIDAQRTMKKYRGSVGNMSPDSEFIQLLASLPIAPGISAHSIIGVQKGPIEEGGDGVVSYQSAHLDDVDSELVVKSSHSSQSNPVVVEEIRRILIEHLGDAIIEEEGNRLEVRSAGPLN